MFMVTPKLCANEMFKYLVMLIVIFSSVDDAVSMRMKSRTVDVYSDKIHNSNRPLTLKECYRTRLKMDDENYRNVINWYKSCIKLGESKSGQQKDAYTMKLIQNLLRSSSEFFSQTKLLPETVARIEKECSSMVDRILYSSSMAPKKSSGTVTDDSNNSTCVKKTKTDDDLAVLLNHIRWAAFIALALILLILIVLLYFCLATFNQSNAQTCKCPCYCAAKNQRSPDKVSSLSNLTIISANQSKEQMQHIPSKPPIMRYKETKKWPNAGTDKCYVRKDYDDVLNLNNPVYKHRSVSGGSESETNTCIVENVFVAHAKGNKNMKAVNKILKKLNRKPKKQRNKQKEMKPDDNKKASHIEELNRKN